MNKENFVNQIVKMLEFNGYEKIIVEKDENSSHIHISINAYLFKDDTYSDWFEHYGLIFKDDNLIDLFKQTRY